MESTYTVLGWAFTLTASGVIWYYYTRPDDRRRPFRGTPTQPPRPAATVPSGDKIVKERKREERRRAGQGSGVDTRRQETSPRSVATTDGGDDTNDIAWARELEKRQKGTNLAPPSQKGNRQRTVKQANANNKAAEISTESSSTGADADDDLSPANSPALNGFQHSENPSGKDVNDMLEPKPAGPSVLKLTESTKTTTSRPKQQSRAAQEQETKKQRQNRKKAEEKKLQREADERERRALEERQRRNARESRGEPAKNGLGISSAPASNAWKTSNHVAAAPIPATDGNAQLLDTFANDTTSTESTTATSGTSSPVQGKSKQNWWNAEIPSEEEQVRLIQEQDDSSWNTVAAKKPKRKANGGAVQPVEQE